MKFADMTFPELRQVPRAATLVLAPIAACEQHSHHLPTITDTVLVTGVADGVEQQLPAQVLQLPTLWLGGGAHHLRFGATLSAEVDTHVAMLCDLLTPLLDDGYQRLLLLNGHGGNIDTMQMALRRLQPRWRNGSWRRRLIGIWPGAELAALAEGERKTMGHACEFETSMMLALRPDLVRREQLRDDPPRDDPALRGLYLAEDMYQRTDHGAVGFPQLATAAQGRLFLNAAIDARSKLCKRCSPGPCPSEQRGASPQAENALTALTPAVTFFTYSRSCFVCRELSLEDFMANTIGWCDIPVLDLDRAIRFYSAVLGTPIKKADVPGMSIGMLPNADSGVSGCLHCSDTDHPSDHGPLIYLSCAGRLDDAVAAVVPNGGKVLQARHAIGPYGFRAVVLDSEGNRVAPHSD